jgi:hypothetical protein
MFLLSLATYPYPYPELIDGPCRASFCSGRWKYPVGSLWTNRDSGGYGSFRLGSYGGYGDYGSVRPDSGARQPGAKFTNF